MKYQGRSGRTRTGGRLRPHRKKRKHELGREAAETELGGERIKVVDARGEGEKRRALAVESASVSTGGETVAAEIEDVVENPANPNYVRRNIITKGAVIETSEGRARVTSRPGQEGQVDAVLIGERRSGDGTAAGSEGTEAEEEAEAGEDGETGAEAEAGEDEEETGE